MNEQLISAISYLGRQCGDLCQTTTRLANVANSMNDAMIAVAKHNTAKHEELMDMLRCLCKELHEYNANHKN